MPKIIVIGHGTPTVKVIVENVVTCFFGTQCISWHLCRRFMQYKRKT